MRNLIRLNQPLRKWALVPAVIVGAFLIASGTALADAPRSERIVRPDAKFQGKTYSQWAASFWQWMLAYPLQGHPTIDDPSFDFSARQAGNVWFWAAPDGPLTRRAS